MVRGSLSVQHLIARQYTGSMEPGGAGQPSRRADLKQMHQQSQTFSFDGTRSASAYGGRHEPPPEPPLHSRPTEGDLSTEPGTRPAPGRARKLSCPPPTMISSPPCIRKAGTGTAARRAM